MIRKTFEPIGQQARWRTLYALLEKMDVGTVLSYEQMGTALELDPRTSRHILQQAIQRAGKELLMENQRAIKSVRGVGYEVATPEGHLAVARSHSKKSMRSLGRAHSVATNVDLTKITDPNVRGALEKIAIVATQQIDFSRRLAHAQKKTDARVTAHVEKTADQISELTARLDKLTRKVEGSES